MSEAYDEFMFNLEFDEKDSQERIIGIFVDVAKVLMDHNVATPPRILACMIDAWAAGIATYMPQDHLALERLLSMIRNRVRDEWKMKNG